jgi:hypothetical protein
VRIQPLIPQQRLNLSTCQNTIEIAVASLESNQRSE